MITPVTKHFPFQLTLITIRVWLKNVNVKWTFSLLWLSGNQKKKVGWCPVSLFPPTKLEMIRLHRSKKRSVLIINVCGLSWIEQEVTLFCYKSTAPLHWELPCLKKSVGVKGYLFIDYWRAANALSTFWKVRCTLKGTGMQREGEGAESENKSRLKWRENKKTHLWSPCSFPCCLPWFWFSNSITE